MKTVMLLLVPAVVILISSSDARPGHRPHPNLSQILDLAKKFNDSIRNEIFVEDVSRLAEGSDRCGNKFFCKVYDILKRHEKTTAHHHKEAELISNLEMYLNSTNVNCDQVLENVTPSEETRPVPDLVRFLDGCIKHKNLQRPNNAA